MPAISPSTRASRCRGPQPVRAQAEPEASSAEKNACETNGLYAVFEPDSEVGSRVGWSQGVEAIKAVRSGGRAGAGVPTLSRNLADGRHRFEGYFGRIHRRSETGHTLRSAIAHDDAHGDQCKDRAWQRRLQGQKPRFKFPAKTLQRSSDPHSAPRARAAQACARSRSTAASRTGCARSRVPAPAAG